MLNFPFCHDNIVLHASVSGHSQPGTTNTPSTSHPTQAGEAASQEVLSDDDTINIIIVNHISKACYSLTP